MYYLQVYISRLTPCYDKDDFRHDRIHNVSICRTEGQIQGLKEAGGSLWNEMKL